MRTPWGSFSKAGASMVLALGVAAGCKASPPAPATETGVASARVAPGAASAPSAGAEPVTWPTKPGASPHPTELEAAYLAGANEKEALLEFIRMPRDHGFFGVVELASGCLREMKPGLELIGPPPMATKGGRSPESWIETLQSREGQAELQQALGLMRQVGVGRLKSIVEIASDAAGRTVLFRGDQLVFRSVDSGATFKLADTSADTISFTPAVSADGRFSAFVRCRPFCERRELAVIDRTGAPKPRRHLGRGSLIAIEPEGRYAYVQRTAGATEGPAQQLCIDRVPLEGGPAETLRCFSASKVEIKWGLIPNAPPGAGVSYHLPVIADVSPGARYALLSLPAPISGDSTRLEVVSLHDGRSVDGVEAYDHDAVVDDRGYVAFDPGRLQRLRAQTQTSAPLPEPKPDAPVRVLAGGTTRDVATGHAAGWAPGGRLLVLDGLAAAARSRCGTIKVVPIAGPLPRARPPARQRPAFAPGGCSGAFDERPLERCACRSAPSVDVDRYASGLRTTASLLRFSACVLRRRCCVSRPASYGVAAAFLGLRPVSLLFRFSAVVLPHRCCCVSRPASYSVVVSSLSMRPTTSLLC